MHATYQTKVQQTKIVSVMHWHSWSQQKTTKIWNSYCEYGPVFWPSVYADVNHRWTVL